jgi:catechol O-methyltransferase
MPSSPTFLLTPAPGDLDDAIRVIDDFCVTRSVTMDVGDEKGEILDREVQRASPSLLLELGTYCGYSGLSAARGCAGGCPAVLDRVRLR